MKFPSIAILTGPGPRHAYFARKLIETFPTRIILIENLVYPSPKADSKQEQDAWDWFFQKRDEYEKQNFGRPVFDPECTLDGNVHPCPSGINDSNTLELLESAHPDAIAVFGTGILGNKILDRFGDRILNFHPGLTWTHRGSSCNFWPLLEDRLDCLGATIIKINQGIDTGEILNWGIIRVEPDDDEQSLIGKTVLLGTELMIDVLKGWMEESKRIVQEKEKGSLYLMKDFNPSATLRLKELVDSGQLTRMVSAAATKA